MVIWYKFVGEEQGMAQGRPMANFGGNVAFVPQAIERPRNAAELAAALRRHRDKRMRCIGARHSWSRIVVTEGVLLDLCQLNHVGVETSARDGPEKAVRVGGGCTLKRLLEALRRDGYTLPTLGAITKQTVAGAISTGTHGSGSHSLSNFVDEVRVANLDANGEPRIETLDSGTDLQAARCALGSLGVIVEAVLRIRRRYRIEERVQKTEVLDEVLAGQEAWPLQQFALLPWSWTYVVYRRRPVEAEGSPWRALLCRAWNFLATDVGLHLILKFLLLCAKVFGERLIRSFFRCLPQLIVAGPARIDDSEAILTMHHDLFRHVEMELFVPESRLSDAIAAIRQIVEIAGEGATRMDRLSALAPERRDEVWKLRGAYTLHYPLFFRRVLPDETLLSMTSAAEQPVSAWYSISFFTYRRPGEDFDRFAGTLARCMRELFGARLHWGKYFPLPLQEAARAYPGFEDFADACRRLDPGNRFAYLDTTAGQPRPAA